ncbi:MAG: hypothetical protein ACI9F9_002869 [Candidatus Paceibacteria bacterium]|jgi:hypothetical protein
MEAVVTSCAHCAKRFEAPARSAGAITNCPNCGLATAVPGGSDVYWNAIVGLAIFGTIICVAIAYFAGGFALAALIFSACALVALVVRLSA